MKINKVDKAKIRTATLLYLQKNKRATSKQIQEHIIAHDIPLIGTGATTPQAITRVLKEAPNTWNFRYERDNRGRCVWLLRE